MEFDCAFQFFNFGNKVFTVHDWCWKFTSLVQTTTKNFLKLFNDWIRSQESIISLSYKIKRVFINLSLIKFFVYQIKTKTYPICWLVFWLCLIFSNHQESCMECCWLWLHHNVFHHQERRLEILVLERTWVLKKCFLFHLFITFA